MRRILIVMLAIALLLASVLPCMAAESNTPVVVPRYTHITANAVDLDINKTTGVANCYASCYTVGNYTVKVECKLQRYQGGLYSTIKTWTDSGDSLACVDEYWAVYSGYQYRVYAIFYVYNSAGKLLESATSSASYNYPKN